MTSLRSILKGLALLRHADLVADLGKRLERLRVIEKARARFPDARISSEVLLLGYDPSRLQLGAGASLREGTILSFGDEHNGFGTICIGAGSWIGQYNNFRAGGGRIEVGTNCLVSQFCSLVASNHGTDRDKPIQAQEPAASGRDAVLGNDVWLGVGVAVLAGTRIGDGAVVGANSVVTTDIPPFEIWGGVPARKLGERR
jgi:acetyltransferase-like isoleucine patch superfamily enzyme